MCESCWEENGSPKIDNARVRFVSDLIKSLYESHASGGHAHVIVDDFNVSDDTIVWSFNDIMDQAEKLDPSDMECNPVEIVKSAFVICAMLFLTREERASALALHDGYWKPEPSHPTGDGVGA